MEGLLKKKVIMVYSLSRGGSTFLAFMLANGPRAIAPGDIWALFYPENEDQQRTGCVCGDPTCLLWQRAREAGVEGFYQMLFDEGYELVVDSAKTLFWYEQQKRYLVGVENRDVVIFKSPLEHAYSFWKRIGDSALGTYNDYYTAALALAETPVVIEYADLVRYPASALQALCERLGVDYRPGKECYWEKKDWHLWGGSNTAVIHFFEKGSKRYEEIAGRIRMREDSNPAVLQHHREIYYSNDSTRLPEEIKRVVQGDQMTQELYQRLQGMKLRIGGQDSEA
jgi:hypothetical protein